MPNVRAARRRRSVLFVGLGFAICIAGCPCAQTRTSTPRALTSRTCGDSTQCMINRPVCADPSGDADGNTRCVSNVCYYTPDPNNAACKCVVGDSDACANGLSRTCVALSSNGPGNESSDWSACGPIATTPPPACAANASWTKLASDPSWSHECGFLPTDEAVPPSDFTPERGKPFMGTRLAPGANDPCVVQSGPAVPLPKGRYRVTFDVWPRGKNVKATIAVLRSGVLVAPATEIAETDGKSTLYPLEFTVPDDCTAGYDFRVTYSDGWANPAAGYVETWATKLESLGP